MKAIGLTRYLPISDPSSLLDLEVPRPEPTGRDLLVRVRAIAVNPVDYKVRAPKDKVESTPRILGWDAAGVVDAAGDEASLFQPGDAVYYAGDITRPGSNQEYQLVDERIVGHKPASLDFAEAAALPLTTITAYEALFDRLGFDVGGADAGKTVLLIGGAGGVGSIAIQLAKLAGLVVVATASRPETRAWVQSLGADYIIDHTRNLREELTALHVGEVDAVAIFNDTDGHFAALPALVKPQGTITSIVENVKPLDLNILKSKSLSFAWEFMFTRSMYRTPDMIEQHHLLDRVAGWVDSGRIRTTLKERVTPINAQNLRNAHAALERGTAIGKIVLEGFPD